MGILIAIDGVDASGKQTQTELLKKRLENDELKIKSVSFRRMTTRRQHL